MKLTGGSNLGYQVAFNCAISQAFVCAVYVLFAVNERHSGAKHMQQIAGVKPLAYWGASLLWDWITYLTVIFSILLLLFWHGDPGYASWKQMGRYNIMILQSQRVITVSMMVILCIKRTHVMISRPNRIRRMNSKNIINDTLTCVDDTE